MLLSRHGLTFSTWWSDFSKWRKICQWHWGCLSLSWQMERLASGEDSDRRGAAQLQRNHLFWRMSRLKTMLTFCRFASSQTTHFCLTGGLNHGNWWDIYNIDGYLFNGYNSASVVPLRKIQVQERWVTVWPHACSQKISGGVHLAASITRLGLECERVPGDAPRAADAHDAASLDAHETAQELGCEIHAAACPFFQTALYTSGTPACVVKNGTILPNHCQDWGLWDCLNVPLQSLCKDFNDLLWTLVLNAVHVIHRNNWLFFNIFICCCRVLFPWTEVVRY